MSSLDARRAERAALWERIAQVDDLMHRCRFYGPADALRDTWDRLKREASSFLSSTSPTDDLRDAASMAAGILRGLRDRNQYAHDGQRRAVAVTLECLHAALGMDDDGNVITKDQP